MHVQGSIGHLHSVACRSKMLNNNASLPLVWTPEQSHSNSLRQPIRSEETSDNVSGLSGGASHGNDFRPL